jgi:hypothetical protein
LLLEAERAGRVKRANFLRLAGSRIGLGGGGSRLTRSDRLRYLPFATGQVRATRCRPSRPAAGLFSINGLAKEGDMRVVTAFKRMLRLDGWASVIDVSFDQKGVIVTFRLRRRRRRICSVCGQTGGHLLRLT